jgi:hypothetical protein
MVVPYGFCDARSSSLGYVVICSLVKYGLLLKLTCEQVMPSPSVYFKIIIVHTSPSKDLKTSQLSVLVRWLVKKSKVTLISLTQHTGSRIFDCPVGNHFDDFSA